MDLQQFDVSSPWVYDQLHVVSATQWQETDIPASALKFNKHFETNQLSIGDVAVFKEFIEGIPPLRDDYYMKAALHGLQVDISISRECLFEDEAGIYIFLACMHNQEGLWWQL